MRIRENARELVPIRGHEPEALPEPSRPAAEEPGRMRTLGGCSLESEDGQGATVAQQSSLGRDRDAPDQHMPPVNADFPSRAADDPTGASPSGVSRIGASPRNNSPTSANLIGTNTKSTTPTSATPFGTTITGLNPTSTDATGTVPTGPLPTDALALHPQAHRRRLEAGHGQIRLAQKDLDLRDLLRRPAPLQLHRSS